jgi:hypothetical protein
MLYIAVKFGALAPIIARSFHVAASCFKDDDNTIKYYHPTRGGKKVEGVSFGAVEYKTNQDRWSGIDDLERYESEKIKTDLDNTPLASPYEAFLQSRAQKAAFEGSTDHHFPSFDDRTDFLRVTKALNKGDRKWTQTTLPSIHARSFPLQLAQAIATLPEGKAYAAHFVVGAPGGNYVSLGPSSIISNRTDPLEYLTHLRDLSRFYEETYDTKFDNYTFLRLRDLGDVSDRFKDIIDHNTRQVSKKGPWGTVRAAANLPFPNFDYLSMFKRYNDQLNSYSDRAEGLRHLARFEDKELGIRLAYWNNDSAEFVFPDRSYIKASLSKDAPADMKLDANTPYRYVNMSYLNPDEKIYIPFNDVELDDSLISRNVRGINMHIDRKTGDVVGYDHKFGNRRFISTAKPMKNFTSGPDRIVTADIEALISNKRDNIPYAAAFYTCDNNMNPIYRAFKWQDYNLDSSLLLKAFWKELILFGYGKTIYFHNWAGYDAFHALNPLVLLAQEMGLRLRPILRHGKIINLKVFRTKNNNKDELVFDIKDSILLLPSGLGSLAKAFKLPVLKEHFPHYFDVLNIAHDANYVGPWPEYDCFEPKRTTIDDYNNLIKENPIFNFMEHTMKYLHLDVKLLHDILVIFFKELGNDFKIDARNNMSIPGVSFKNWKISQLPTLINENKNNAILDFSEKFDGFFRDAYLGGIVDVYRPRISNGFYYDVNSLYPSAMLKDLPVGSPIFQVFPTNVFLETDWFGFVHCTVKAPENLNIGILSIRVDGKLITPTGIFNGTFFSEELRFALKYGYTILGISYGYKFNKSNKVFDNLIHNLSNMKIKAELDNNSGKRTIAKLMMNSTYGRFGMHPEIGVSTIVSEQDAINIHRAFDVIRCIPFTNGYELLEYNPRPGTQAIDAGLVTFDQIKPYIFYQDAVNETNVPLAAAITAQSRIIINSYKMKCLELGIDVIYSDTDSLVVNKEIPQEWIHNTDFGKFKLEHVIKEGYFIAPKLYFLECVNPKTGETYTVSKCRGYNGKLDLAQIIRLYEGKSVDVTTMKWFRSWPLHTVYFNMDNSMEIKGTFSKRTKIFDNEGNWVNTKPIHFNMPIVKPMVISPIEFNETDRNTGYFWRIQRMLMHRNPKIPMRSPAAFKAKK